MDTATRSSNPEPAFHTDDDTQVAEYRTLSALAIVSLVLGLLSLLAFASLLFIVVPVVGAAIALIALGRIAASGGILTGRRVAAIGLALCVVCGTGGVTRDYIRRHLRTGEAVELGRDWIRHVAAGEMEQAFELTVDSTRPAPPPDEAIPGPKVKPLEAFNDHAVVQEIVSAGADAEIEPTQTLEFLRQSRGHYYVRQQYRITPGEAAERAGAHADPIDVVLSLQRSRLPGDRQLRWLVARYEEAGAAEHFHSH